MYADERVMDAIRVHHTEKYEDVLFRYALYMEGREPGTAELPREPARTPSLPQTSAPSRQSRLAILP
jgi:hypothetical protein